MKNEIILRERKKGALLKEFIGEITEEMDKFLLFENEEQKEILKDVYKTYIVIHSEDKTILCFRVPGATRGCIRLDSNNIIKEITFYNNQCFGVIKCYKKEIADYIIQKYIGYKIIFEDKDIKKEDV